MKAYKSGAVKAGKMVRLGSNITLTFQKAVRKYNADNLVALFPFDEISGTTAIDEIGGRNQTYIGSPTMNDDVFEGKPTVYFRGTQRININTLANTFLNKDEVTMIIWAKPKSLNGLFSMLNSVFSLRYATNEAITVNNGAAGNYFGFARLGAGSVGYSYISQVLVDNFVMIAFTWSVSQNKAIPYINCALINKAGGSTTATPNIISCLTNFDTTLCGIGSARGTSNEANFVGNFANFTILDKCLSQSELLNLFNYPVVWFAGDSRTANSPFATCCLRDKIFTPIVIAVSGTTIQSQDALAVTAIDANKIAGRKNIVVLFCGVNNAGETAEVIYNRLKTFCLNRKAAGLDTIVVGEIDAQDATRNTSGWHAAKKADINARLRADHSFALDFVDMDTNIALQDATNQTYFNADFLHPRSAGVKAISDTVYPILHSHL